MGFWSTYMGIYGGGQAIVEADYSTKRLKLIGAPKSKLPITAMSQNRLSITATSEKQVRVAGCSR